MKAKHIFICDSEVTPAMRVHLVMIGSSDREQRMKERLQACAARNPDAYFHIFDDDVCKFLSNLAMQVYPLLSPRDARHKFDECNVIRCDASSLLHSNYCLRS